MSDCGMKRIRQLQPQGVNILLTVVVNFHPHFMTKLDRAFSIRCFYGHKDASVTTDMEIKNGFPSETLEQATYLMPQCEYSLREGTFDGPRIRSTTIGKPIVHRWDCNNNGHYGILVRNCIINDGRGESMAFLDNRGCPIYDLPIPPLVYDATYSVAYTVVEAVTFPDQMRVFFQCQIQVCDKMNEGCIGITPPNCPPIVMPGGFPSNPSVNPNVPSQVIGSFSLGNHISETSHEIPAPDGTIGQGMAFEHRIPDPWLKEHVLVDEKERTQRGAHNEPKPTPINKTENLNTTTSYTVTASYSESSPTTKDSSWAIPVPPSNDIDEDHNTNSNHDGFRSWEAFFGRVQQAASIVSSTTTTTPKPSTSKNIQTTTSSQESRLTSTREKRLADSVMDVVSSPIYIRDSEGLDDDEHWAEQRAKAASALESHNLTCLSPTAVSIMGVAFIGTVIFCIGLIVYLTKDYFRMFIPDMGLNNSAMSHLDTSSSCSSRSSCTNETFSPNDNVIYTRKLGDVNYVVAAITPRSIP
ncbi:hypothetical protein WR25_00190 [Diploscapter pachys]|uniref:ZP domain-containing protein n=1 Tax=Diploscapter pachys TaxID=2018661 RepID=A0A2A2J481_9BILA|nr:hypothetical protein WR25_00190 [Diploscapter pachys]